MKLSCVSTFVCLLLLLGGTAQAVMVDFESPTYTAGNPWVGVDGWVPFSLSDWSAPTIVTPSGGYTTVLSGAQSGGLGGATLSGVGRLFDVGTEFATGDYRTVVSCLVQGGGTGGVIGFNLSDNPAMAGTPGGIELAVGGTIKLFGNTAGYYIDSGIPFVSGNTYKLELEVNVDNNTIKGFFTNLTTSGARTSLGSLPMFGSITPASYPTCGVALTANSGALAAFDDFDVYEVAASANVPLLPEPVDFEHAVYVAGNSVAGVDGWNERLGVGSNLVSNTAVLEGSKSLQVSDSGSLYILGRKLGAGTTYDTGTIVSAKMMATDGEAGAQAEFHFSNNINELHTPAGIIGVVGGNFWVFGKEGGDTEDPTLGLDSGIAFSTDVEYLLELDLDLTNQTFDAYATDLTNSGPRTFLRTAELWTTAPMVPGDDSNSGYFLITRGGATVLYDALDCKVPEPSTLVALMGLMLSAIVCICRRKVA